MYVSIKESYLIYIPNSQSSIYNMLPTSFYTSFIPERIVGIIDGNGFRIVLLAHAGEHGQQAAEYDNPLFHQNDH